MLFGPYYFKICTFCHNFIFSEEENKMAFYNIYFILITKLHTMDTGHVAFH